MRAVARSLIVLIALGVSSAPEVKGAQAGREGWWKRTVAVRIRDCRSGVPVRCCNLLVSEPGGHPLGQLGTQGDMLGFARLGFPAPGKWIVRFLRAGYFDTTAVVVLRSGPADTLLVSMRPTGGWIVPCHWGEWEGTSEVTVDPESAAVIHE